MKLVGDADSGFKERIAWRKQFGFLLGQIDPFLIPLFAQSFSSLLDLSHSEGMFFSFQSATDG